MDRLEAEGAALAALEAELQACRDRLNGLKRRVGGILRQQCRCQGACGRLVRRRALGPHSKLPRGAWDIAAEHPLWCHKCCVAAVLARHASVAATIRGVDDDPIAKVVAVTEITVKADAAERVQAALVAKAVEASSDFGTALAFLKACRAALRDWAAVRENVEAAIRAMVEVIDPPPADGEMHQVHRALMQLTARSELPYARSSELVVTDWVLGEVEIYPKWHGEKLFEAPDGEEGVDLGEVCAGCNKRLMGVIGCHCGSLDRSYNRYWGCNLDFCSPECSMDHLEAHYEDCACVCRRRKELREQARLEQERECRARSNERRARDYERHMHERALLR